MIDRPPVAEGPTWQAWGQRLTTYLQRIRENLRWKRGDENAAENGIILWDESIKSPVVSVDGAFTPFILKDGHGIAYSTTDITPAVINTAYAIQWDAISLNDGVSIGTPTSRLVFASGGTFMLSFSVQITSSDASTKSLWFWPRINGVDIPNSTMKSTMHNNSETTVLSRTALFDITAGDYLEAMYESSSTAITLESAPAGTNAPATPSVIMAITRIHQ